MGKVLVTVRIFLQDGGRTVGKEAEGDEREGRGEVTISESLCSRC